ncbi:MAG: hypothetical protein CVU64_11140 [Deltaproteobacteria bacterium HGW-Deltaproteobacteria-21]|nr:MAG: hypothetical protein CVU64_11140 [Deltaproteobacteria bacterium HGW-Deltaproteobacteria-21]
MGRDARDFSRASLYLFIKWRREREDEHRSHAPLSSVTTQVDVNSGIVNIVVGFAPLKPNEFIIIKAQPGEDMCGG